MTSQHSTVDSIYYAHGMKLPLSRRVAIFARKRMLTHFISTMQPTPAMTIVDFGVSEEITDEANVLEQHYPYAEQITCLGIGAGEAVRQAFPNIQYRSITPNQPLPFASHTFDIAFSNAVFEHLGTDDNMRRTLNELLRIAKKVYITVPNAWFPVEHHTGIPLLHFSPALFRRTLANTKLAFWANPDNMDFLTQSRLRRLCPRDRTFNLAYCGVQLGPFSSNIALWTP